MFTKIADIVDRLLYGPRMAGPRRYADEDDIEASSGQYVNVLRPHPGDIDIQDIAHALSMQCRFNGHIRKFYSVAEHCIRVANHLPPALRIHGLLHDAAEAYLGDIVTPVKHLLFGYRRMEESMLRAIYTSLGLPLPTRAERAAVKRADMLALREEAWTLLPSRGRWRVDSTVTEPEETLLCLGPADAELMWLGTFKALREAVGEQRGAAATQHFGGTGGSE